MNTSFLYCFKWEESKGILQVQKEVNVDMNFPVNEIFFLVDRNTSCSIYSRNE